MNQSILFPDLQQWDEQKQSIVFPAQQAGMLIECVVSLARLSALSGLPLQSGDEALQQFKALRFDLEELAEERIEDELFNSDGQIEI